MTPQEDKYLRQLIRKDVKEIAKIQKYQDDDYSESDEEQRLEDKVQYGSDSESDVPSQSPYLEYMDDDDEMYGPEDLEMEDDNEEAIEMGDDELQFDEDQESDTTPMSESGSRSDRSQDKLVDTSDSARSQDVITESIDDSSAKAESDRYEESKTPAGSLEMVDLSHKKRVNQNFDQGEMREFKPAGTVNQSAKKREKRKAKK